MDLAHDRYGSGPPLVLLPGIGSHRQTWAPVVGRLATARELIIVDLPGFGDSAALPAGVPSDVGTLTEAVRAFCDRLGLERPHVAGNSLGAAIALELARLGAVDSATALAPIGFWTPVEVAYAGAVLRTNRAFARGLRPLAPRLLRSAPARAVLLSAFFARPGRLSAEAAVAAVEAFAAAPAFDATLRHTSRYVFPAGDQLRVPVTIAWGTRDRLLLPSQATRARGALPQARHLWLHGCGHLPMSDDPALVADVLLSGSRGQ